MTLTVLLVLTEKMMRDGTEEYRMIYVDYYIEIYGKTISLDREIDAAELGIKDGDQYTVRVSSEGKITFVPVQLAAAEEV